MFPRLMLMFLLTETYRRIASVDFTIPEEVSAEAADLITSVRRHLFTFMSFVRDQSFFGGTSFLKRIRNNG